MQEIEFYLTLTLTLTLTLGWEDPLEKETATHSSILVWKIPWTEEPGGLQSMGGTESDVTERLTHTHTQEAIIFHMNNAWYNRIMYGLKDPFQGQITSVDCTKLNMKSSGMQFQILLWNSPVMF